MTTSTDTGLPISEMEMEFLTERAAPEESLLYLILRKTTDIRIPNEHFEKVNMPYLAQRMSRKSRQGKAELKYSRKDISRLIDRLEHLGMVTDIIREDQSLKMRFPHAVYEN